MSSLDQPGTPPLASTQMQVDPSAQEFQLVDLSRHFLAHDTFWTLPEQFLGNKARVADASIPGGPALSWLWVTLGICGTPTFSLAANLARFPCRWIPTEAPSSSRCATSWAEASQSPSPSRTWSSWATGRSCFTGCRRRPTPLWPTGARSISGR